MELATFLESRPSGARAALAKALGIAPAYLYQIERGIRPIPVSRIVDLSRATNWQVTPHELRPDIYPHPEDGLPPERRGECGAEGKAA